MTPKKHLMLGLLFLTAIGILGYFTLFKTNFSLFDEPQELVVFAEDARGLRKGSPVLYAGVRWGEVTAVVPDLDRPPSERVRIELELDEPIRLFEDHEVTIEAASVLGGVQLGIDPGRPEAGEIEARTDDPLQATSSPDVLAAVGELVEENREPLRNAIAGIEEIVTMVRSGEGTIGRLLTDEELANDVANSIEAIQGTFDNFEALTEELRGGQGTIGKLIYDTKLYDDIEEFVQGLEEFTSDASRLLDDARNGEGLFATLVYDAETAENVRVALESVRSAATKIDEGTGTIGRLLNDGTIADEIEALIRTFNNPDGTIGRLINDPKLYEDVMQIVADVQDATSALREQRGVLGALVYDSQARDAVLQAINVLVGSLEEQREAAPIATFLSTVFLGF